MTVPTYSMAEQEALDAFAVHCALLKAERADPRLRDNPQWTIHRQDAFEAFSKAFTVLA
jgi:hypothetical protein